ncbi:type II secretion system F family protein [Microbacterium hominis]|uniref:Type II secretion system F family protein n=1 Tax=Microbacterium hominis TaxID=162426 RepID=A0A7D4UB52_9MICO|nr:type II secretion system F family protein [Microbacterium hominis]QKJ19163.1 type II secretion system F family protein [Microbacterium hominis]
MIVLWGATLAAGLLLTFSPWLWPSRPRRVRTAVAGGVAERVLGAAGFASTPAAVLYATSAGAGALGAAVAWLIAPVAPLAAVAAVAGAAAPTIWLRSRAARLRRSRRTLWPDVCDLLIASVRAGMSLPDAVSALADSAPAQMRPTFAAFRADMSASGHFDSSIATLKATLADPIADRILETLRMARQVGGTELTTVLRSLATSVRSEATVRAEVEARQSWTRGAAVLGVSAPWVILAMLALRPEGAQAYGSPEGVALVIGGAVMSVVAFRLMIRLGRLSEPRRWFE